MAEDAELFSKLESQFAQAWCEAEEKCDGMGEGKWFLRFSCPGCAALRIPTEERMVLSMLCCNACADWIINDSFKSCKVCGWLGKGYGRVAVVAYLDAAGEIVVGEDISEVVAIMDATPEYSVEDEGLPDDDY